MTVNKLQLPAKQNAVQQKINEIIDNLGGSGANTDLSNLTATGEAHFQEPLVSGTNIKTINSTSLLGSGNIDTSEIFVAEYGVTSFADIETAYNAGKAVFCKYNNNIVPITNIASNTSCVFYSSLGTSNRQITCAPPASWDNQLYLLEKTSNKVTSISSSSTDTQYPSAKLLYDQLLLKQNTSTAVTHTANTAVGSSTTPVYIASNGTATSTGLSIASSRFDGQWVFKYANVTDGSVAIGSYTYSLTSYLPDSTYTYEIYIRFGMYHTTNARGAVGTATSPYTNSTSCYNLRLNVSGNSRQADVVGILPFTNRTLYYQAADAKANTFVIDLLGYRRIGTNS